MTVQPVHVGGTTKHEIMLYALSTCIHCKKTREYLENLKVAFDYIYVDQVPRSEMDSLIHEVEKYNPKCSFPTLVIDKTKVIIGSQLDLIKEALE